MGVKVVVHEPHVPPRQSELASVIEPGTEAYLSIEKTIIENLPKPYSKVHCVLEKDLNKYQYMSNTPIEGYSFEECTLDCMIYHAIDSCNCSFDEGPNLCTVDDFYFCIKPEQEVYFTKCDCHYPCKQTIYNTKLGTLKLATPITLQRSINTYNTEEDFKKNMVFLNAFFPVLQYTKIQQIEAFTFVGLVSNLGGQLGLFLGASLLTMGEILDYLFHSWYRWLKTKMSRKKCNPVPKKIHLQTKNRNQAWK